MTLGVLPGRKVTLRIAVPSDWREFRALREWSRDFLESWEPKWDEEILTETGFGIMIMQHWAAWKNGTDYIFTIFFD
jgi:ribosomal-protein-alanine N-acetyltransferase